MSNTNTGGPAFPSGLIDPSTPEDAVQSLHNGMTLRDYFAAKALSGFFAAEPPTHSEMKESKTIAEFFAFAAYEYADAMLKARES